MLALNNKTLWAKVIALTAFMVVAPSVAIAPSIKRSASQHARSVDDTPTVKTASTGFSGAQAATVAPFMPLPKTLTRVLEIKSGDTLMKLALGAGIERRQAHEAITAFREIYDPRRLRPGQRLTVTYSKHGEDDDRINLRGLRLDANAYQRYAVNRSEDEGFIANELTKKLETQLVRAEGTIGANLFDDGAAAGLPPPVLLDLIRLYSWDVDFQRDLQPDDRFEVVFERISTVDGDHVREGDIIFSRLELSGTPLVFYRFEYAPDKMDYFDPEGQSVRKPLLRTPVDGARLSSRYGRRKHPILGYTRMHRGVDFAAPTGTPIYAAGNGTVVKAGWNGGYGRYVRIRHNAEYSTAYGHMRSLKKGIKTGSRVKQGQIIGYVGTSGRSTGPHLHYEILEKGRQVNPLRVRLPSGRKLKGDQLQAFARARAEIDRRIAELPSAIVVARD